jgi:hypothetical protein
MSIIGNVNFNDDSQNFGLIDGTAVFNDNSQNEGVVEGDATFTESSENNGTVTGDSSFEDSSKNQGSVEGDADFYDVAANDGIVAGKGTFNNNSVNSGSVNNIELKDNASVTQSSIFNGYNGTQIYYPYQKSDGLFYVLNKNGMEESAGYTLIGVYDQGVPKLTPKQITPIKFFGDDYGETWDRHSNPSEKEKAINFYEKVYNFLSGEMPPAPLDGPTLDVYEGSREEWALLLTRMAYFESSYNTTTVSPNGVSFGVFQMGIKQNSLYKFFKVEVGNKTTYPNFTMAQMHDDDFQLRLAWKALNQNLTADSYNNDEVATPGPPTFLKPGKEKLAHAWGAPTTRKIIKELTLSPKFYSYENGNKNSPVNAHGCYTNGFYRHGLRNYSSIFVPTPAKDTDDAVIQHAINEDNKL